MKIKIKSKKYVGNIRNKTNTVYFEINGIPKEVQIVNWFNYEEGTSFNYFIETENNNKLWEYIKSCGYDLKTVQDGILYEIWKYSHGKRGEFKLKSLEIVKSQIKLKIPVTITASFYNECLNNLFDFIFNLKRKDRKNLIIYCKKDIYKYVEPIGEYFKIKIIEVSEIFLNDCLIILAFKNFIKIGDIEKR